MYLSGTLSGIANQAPLDIVLPGLPPIKQSGSGGPPVTGSQVLVPGSYGEISFSKNNNVLTFNGPGVYKFTSINITSNNNEFVFNFNNLDGDIILYIEGDVNFGKSSARLEDGAGGSPSRILTEINGDGSTNGGYAFSMDNGKGGGGSKWLGTLLVPNGNVLFGSGSGSIPVVNTRRPSHIASAILVLPLAEVASITS